MSELVKKKYKTPFWREFAKSRKAFSTKQKNRKYLKQIMQVLIKKAGCQEITSASISASVTFLVWDGIDKRLQKNPKVEKVTLFASILKHKFCLFGFLFKNYLENPFDILSKLFYVLFFDEVKWLSNLLI